MSRAISKIEVSTSRNKFVVTQIQGKPTSVEWEKPLDARDELELLMFPNDYSQFVLQKWYEQQAAA